MMSNDLAMCGCGYEDGIHPVGIGNCCRYLVTDPSEIPHNRRRFYHPDWFGGEPAWVWDVGDSWVTEYTLFQQRMYAQDENGNWTRPKSKDSVNSIKG